LHGELLQNIDIQSGRVRGRCRGTHSNNIAHTGIYFVTVFAISHMSAPFGSKGYNPFDKDTGMKFHSFLMSLKQIVGITNFDDRVNTLVPMLTNLDSVDIIPFVNLSHRDWPSGFVKAQQLSHNLNANPELSTSPTISEVYDLLCQVTATESTSTLTMLNSVLERFGRLDVDWIYNLIAGNNSVRLSTEIILEALIRITSTKGVEKDGLWHAYAISRDVGKTAQVVLSGNLTHLGEIVPIHGLPIIREHIPTLSPVAAWEKLGPCLIETKRDGYYCQVHKKGDDVILYSVKGENWATKYPDHFSEIITCVRQHIQLDEAIVEAELIALDKQRQLLSRKLFWEALHYKLLVYDLLLVERVDWTRKPYYMRRDELIRAISRDPDERITIPDDRFVQSLAELEQAFVNETSPEFEGVVAKLPAFILRPGQKSVGRVKVKKHENIDVTLVGVMLRTSLNGDELPDRYLLAIYDPRNDRFLTIGFASEGMQQEDYEKLLIQIQGLLIETKPFRVLNLTDQTPDRWVEPKIVLEVKFNKIEISGKLLASKILPRVLGIRFANDCLRTLDKKPEDSSTIEDLEDYATLNQA
jgi:DNA ligase 1